MVIEQNKPLPRTTSELYEGVLSPILNKWSQEGRLDYSDLLIERAYDMLCAKEQFFNPANNPFPVGLLNPLAESRKFLIPQDGNYIFRHDLVRAYLAARYFASGWRERLDAEVAIDTNWLEMLKFAIQLINRSDEVRSLLFTILDRNIDIAKELFKWLSETRPDLCEGWTDEFKLRSWR